MKDKTVSKLAWHVHHNILCEVLTEPLKNRIAYINNCKPQNEIALRLRLLKLIKGPLPKGLRTARMRWYAAQVKWGVAQRKWYGARRELTSMEEMEWGVDYKKFCAARAKYNVAYRKWRHILSKDYKSFILELHNKECPSCPWNRVTIFPKES